MGNCKRVAPGVGAPHPCEMPVLPVQPVQQSKYVSGTDLFADRKPIKNVVLSVLRTGNTGRTGF